MEKNDYVICSWCGADDIPDFEYNYLYNVTHNEAVYEAKFRSDQQTLYKYKDLIYEELDKYFSVNDGFSNVSKFADIYEEIMNNFQRFKVWKVDSNISKEVYNEFIDPDIFCIRYCERVA